MDKDFEKARYWYERGVFEGDLLEAALALGKFYYMGMGVPVDYEKAYSYYAKLENTNNAVALLRLGILFELGKGVPKDPQRARDFYRRAAKLKNIFARKNLGVFEVKHGNILWGLVLWSSAIIQGFTLGLLKESDRRLRNW